VTVWLELRAPPAIPAAVESRCRVDGERRHLAAGACRRERRGRSRRPAPFSSSHSGSGSTPGIGCRSPSAAAWELAPRTRSGVCLRRFRRRGGGCGTRCRGEDEGTSTRWRSRRPASGSRSRRKRGHTTIAISRGCANRRRGYLAGVGGGADAARCRWSAWFAHAASSGLSNVLVVSIDRLIPVLRSAVRGLGRPDDELGTR
jgi:hypothetical protein